MVGEMGPDRRSPGHRTTCKLANPKDDRSRSLAVAKAIFCELLSPQQASGLAEDMLQISAEDIARCSEFLGDRPCRHVSQGLVPVDVEETRPQGALAHSLVALAAAAVACAALRGWLNLLLGSLEHMMVASINANEYSSDMLQVALLQGRSKRLRLDEDYIAAVHSAVAEGRARCAGALVRAGGGLAVSSANNLPGRWLSQYQAAGFLTFTSGDLSLAMDGSRVGNPAQENEVLAVWSPIFDRGMVLPVQAGAGRTEPQKPEPCHDPLRIHSRANWDLNDSK